MAFMAGNVQAQLESGVKGNDPYSGFLQVLRVYHLVRQQDKEYKLEAVEKLLKMHKEGKLLKYALELKEKRDKDLKPPKKEL